MEQTSGPTSAAAALCAAISGGDVQQVISLLDADPTLANARDDNGVPVVLLAAYHGRPDIAGTLIARGAELDIFTACANGRLDWVEQRVPRDPDLINRYAPDGFTPLGLASFLGHQRLVEYLLAHGADVNAVSRNQTRYTALTGAVAANRLGIAQLLIRSGADVNHVYINGYTPLLIAAFNGSLELVQFLLDHGAHVDARTEAGDSPLSLAVQQGHDQVVTLLRDHGATG